MEKKQTPMMIQYEEIKSRHQEELLFFRLGDFYELFFDDALIASKELNITLTGRSAGTEEKAPMCGVPYHAADTYILKLIKKGYKVAICEQVEDPKSVKGIVRREVVRIITPGTIVSEQGTDSSENNFLGIFYQQQDTFVVIYTDVSTGEVFWSKSNLNEAADIVIDTLAMYRPTEIVLVDNITIHRTISEFLQNQLNTTVISKFSSEKKIDSDFLISTKKHFNLDLFVDDTVVVALGILLAYLQTVLKTELKHINHIQEISTKNRMILDTSCLRHLEITRNLRDGGTKGTLLSILNRTETPMGARLLKQWIESPLTDIYSIQYRQQAVSELVNQRIMQQELQHVLSKIFDFERIITRIETGAVAPRDFAALRESLTILPSVKKIIENVNANYLKSLNEHISLHTHVCELLSKAIADQPALNLKDGRVIRDGYNEELDELRSLASNSQVWLQKLEDDIKTKTGIKLRTGYNKVFGYYFEVTNTHKDSVPDYFIRKQTLANAERYITPELKEFEIKILSAKDKMVALEQKLYQELRLHIQSYIKPIQETARALAQLDAILSLAIVAYEERYILPSLVKNGKIMIKDGRHPVIESFLKQEVFVPNDVELNHENEEFLLITGPNMAGKSTYMRQTAILMIMAQIGSYIPAREAIISPVDRIFTRVGASDDISTGQSTFMVEMKEVAYILNHATKNSLIILDEIGRGTSTFDGLSIAQAVVEYIVKHVHAKTMFATHYHELTPLENSYKNVKNYTVAVKEKGKSIVFLRRIVRGGADKSYGIHVAKLAGLPQSVLTRSQEILDDLESGKGTEKVQTSSFKAVADEVEKNDLFSNSVLDELQSIDVLSLTPIEALNILYKLQEDARKGGGK